MISASLQQRKTRTRRSMLFVPGANAAMVSNSFIYPADALMFDLEDSVALREKDTARRMVYHALQHPLYRDIERLSNIKSSAAIASLVFFKSIRQTDERIQKVRNNFNSKQTSKLDLTNINL